MTSSNFWRRPPPWKKKKQKNERKNGVRVNKCTDDTTHLKIMSRNRTKKESPVMTYRRPKNLIGKFCHRFRCRKTFDLSVGKRDDPARLSHSAKRSALTVNRSRFAFIIFPLQKNLGDKYGMMANRWQREKRRREK